MLLLGPLGTTTSYMTFAFSIWTPPRLSQTILKLRSPISIHNSYDTQKIVMTTKSRRITSVGSVVFTGKIEMHTEFCSENLTEIDL
jgi:hypothetical protein